MFTLRRTSLPTPPPPSSTPISTTELPLPDYNDDSCIGGADPSLLMPTVIQYDEWANTEAEYNESFPEPPASLTEGYTEDEFPEPPPDYDLPARDNPVLIQPHKLPNPVLESKDRMKLNKEIKFNSKRQVNVLEKKPELQKELDRRKQEKLKKEQIEEQKKSQGTFGRKLSLQYEKLAQLDEEEKVKVERERKRSEFEKIHEKILTKPTLTAPSHHS